MSDQLYVCLFFIGAYALFFGVVGVILESIVKGNNHNG